MGTTERPELQPTHWARTSIGSSGNGSNWYEGVGARVTKYGEVSGTPFHILLSRPRRALSPPRHPEACTCPPSPPRARPSSVCAASSAQARASRDRRPGQHSARRDVRLHSQHAPSEGPRARELVGTRQEGANGGAQAAGVADRAAHDGEPDRVHLAACAQGAPLMRHRCAPLRCAAGSRALMRASGSGGGGHER